jgi:transposase-like protein
MMSNTTPSQQNPVCPECGCKNTVKKGKRRNRLQTLQVYRCTECLYRFTSSPGKNKSYPLKLILETVSTFDLGYSLTETQRIMDRRFHRAIPERTIRSWLMESRPITTYTRLRTPGKKLFTPETIVRTLNFHHQQVYRHQVHRPKLQMLLEPAAYHAFAPLKDYLAQLEVNFPHELFQKTEHRSSKFPADLRPEVTRKENHATATATLVLPTAPNNRKRHETLQRFMLVNDSVTVAVEVPVFLTQEDIRYYRSRGFDLDFESDVITGHIDFLQIRNGHIHILDYKPEARKETHAHVQLTIYALALARRTSLPLRFFKCGWFDERDYFEFYPLKGVYPIQKAQAKKDVSNSSLRVHGVLGSMRGELQNTAPTIGQPHY